MLEAAEAHASSRRMIVLASRTSATPIRGHSSRSGRAQAVEPSGSEARLNLAQAGDLVPPRAPNRMRATKQSSARRGRQERGNIRPPKALADGEYYGRKLGKGEGYIYPHSRPGGLRVDYLAGRAERDDVTTSRRGAARRRRLDGRNRQHPAATAVTLTWTFGGGGARRTGTTLRPSHSQRPHLSWPWRREHARPLGPARAPAVVDVAGRRGP